MVCLCKPVGLSLFSECCQLFCHNGQVPERPKIPKSLRDFYCLDIKAEDVAAKIEEICSIPITEAERDFIEQSTNQITT